MNMLQTRLLLLMDREHSCKNVNPPIFETDLTSKSFLPLFQNSWSNANDKPPRVVNMAGVINPFPMSLCRRSNQGNVKSLECEIMAITALRLDKQSFHQYPSASSASIAYWLFHSMLVRMFRPFPLTSPQFVTDSDESRFCAKPRSSHYWNWA